MWGEVPKINFKQESKKKSLYRGKNIFYEDMMWLYLRILWHIQRILKKRVCPINCFRSIMEKFGLVLCFENFQNLGKLIFRHPLDMNSQILHKPWTNVGSRIVPIIALFHSATARQACHGPACLIEGFTAFLWPFTIVSGCLSPPRILSAAVYQQPSTTNGHKWRQNDQKAPWYDRISDPKNLEGTASTRKRFEGHQSSDGSSGKDRHYKMIHVYQEYTSVRYIWRPCGPIFFVELAIKKRLHHSTIQ